MNHLSIFTISVLCLFTGTAHTSVGTDLGDFFDGLGMTTNVTGASADQGQQAGFYTGGSLYMRTRNQNAQLASIQLPSYSAGCGGIDIFGGGFSFINADEIIAMGKSIMNGGAGYSFRLALATISPMMESQMSQLQKWANDVTQFNINSCEASANLIDNTLSKSDIVSQRLCESVGDDTSQFADRIRARYACGSGGQRTKTLNDAENDPLWQDYIAQNTNITWKALQKSSFLSIDKDLAAFLMSLAGTIVLKHNNAAGATDEDPQEKMIWPPLGQGRNLLNALLNGGTVDLYQCSDKADCLNVTIESTTIDASDALVARVEILLESLMDKVLNDSKLSDVDINFLNSTSFPILKMFTVELAAKKSANLTNIISYAQPISLDILQLYLAENMQLIKTLVQRLPLLADSDLERFNAGWRDTRAQINEIINNSKSNTLAIDLLIQRLRWQEEKLAGDLSAALVNAANYNKGL